MTTVASTPTRPRLLFPRHTAVKRFVFNPPVILHNVCLTPGGACCLLPDLVVSLVTASGRVWTGQAGEEQSLRWGRGPVLWPGLQPSAVWGDKGENIHHECPNDGPSTLWTTKSTVWTTKQTWSTTSTGSSSTTKPTVWTTKPTIWTTTTTVWTTTTVASTSTTTSTTSSILTQRSKSWTTSVSTPQTYQLNRLLQPVKSSRLKPNAMKDIFKQNMYKKPAGEQNKKLLKSLRKLLMR